MKPTKQLIKDIKAIVADVDAMLISDLAQQIGASTTEQRIVLVAAIGQMIKDNVLYIVPATATFATPNKLVSLVPANVGGF